MAEHYRPKIGNKPSGYYQGYYCSRCGATGVSMKGKRDHAGGVCLTNPLMIKKLDEANTAEAEQKRKFVHGLKEGKTTNSEKWEYDIPRFKNG